MPIQIGRKAPGFRNPGKDFNGIKLAQRGAVYAYVDTGTVYIAFSILSHDCYFAWAPSWTNSFASNKWTAASSHKWTAEISHKWIGTENFGVEEEC